MKIEHLAYSAHDPAAVAAWYAKHMGFTIKRKMDTPPFMHFICDDSGKVMIELYNNPAVKVPDYKSMDPLLLHLAFVSSDVRADRDRLLKAGCSLAADVLLTPGGDELVMLRDPFGFAIQLCKRRDPMV